MRHLDPARPLARARRQGQFLAINASNVGRAVPSLALIAFFIAYIGVGFTNLTLALVLLAIPPILTNTYVGVRQVDRDDGRRRPRHGHDRRADRPPRRAAALASTDLRRHPHLGRQRRRHRDDRSARGRVTLGDPIINVNVYGDEGRLGGAIVVAVLAVVTEVSLAAAATRRHAQGLEARGGRAWRRFAVPIKRRDAPA